MPPAGAKLRAAKIFIADSEEFEIPAVTSVSRQQLTKITQAEALKVITMPALFLLLLTTVSSYSSWIVSSRDANFIFYSVSG